MKQRSKLMLRGIIPIIPTPFKDNEDIDFQSLNKELDFAVAAGAGGICTPAYASEFYKLSDNERRDVIAAAIHHVNRRVPVLGQVNHGSAKNLIELAKFVKSEGGEGIAIAVPRALPSSEDDLFDYFSRILNAVDIPLLIQDFNPGGPTISLKFISRLHKEFPYFQYVKLEEPLMAPKVRAIIEETNNEIGVIEGWGGMFIIELVSAGICGVMPDLALTDLLNRIFNLSSEGKKAEAYEIFQGVLPEIVFSLQNMEFYHTPEKSLLQARGVLSATTVRSLKLSVDKYNMNHINFLNQKILELLDKLDMSRNYRD